VSVDWYDEITEPERFPVTVLLNAAGRFRVPGRAAMTKAELVEALDMTAWSPAAEVPHFYLDEHHAKNGQPPGTCAVCFRPRLSHGVGQPGRIGWPSEWRWQLGQPFPD
jgi:hypothetical protein